MKEAPIEMPPITADSLPKTIEQQILAALLRIETLLDENFNPKPYTGPPFDLADMVTKLEPTKTPFMESIGKKKK